VAFSLGNVDFGGLAKAMKRVAILQSNYIPWKGYFDLIASVDEFIIYDEMQYTRRDWRNRNQIKTPQGLQWLTVPVIAKGKYYQKISETEIEGDEWAKTHWRTITVNYKRAPYFNEVSKWLERFYLPPYAIYLSNLNRGLIVAICDYLDIETKITNCTEYEIVDGKTERLASLCAQAGGTEYVSGPSAKNYIDEGVFEKIGVCLKWFEYGGYCQYPQLWGDFVHEVSIIDVLFNCGKSSRRYMSNGRHPCT
jgi:hypothetical protein